MKRVSKLPGREAAFAIYSPKYFPHYVGGGERLVQMTAAGLRKLGVSVVIISDGELGEYEFDGIRVLTLPHRADEVFLGNSGPCQKMLRDVLRELRVQAVHTITVRGLSSLACAAEELKLCLGMAAMDYGLVCDRRTLIHGGGGLCKGCRPSVECFNCRLKSLRVRDKLAAWIGRRLPDSCGLTISRALSRLAGRPLGRQLTWWGHKVAADARLSRAIERLDAFISPTHGNMELARSRLPGGIVSEVIMFPLPKELLSPEPKKVPSELLRIGFVGRPIAIKGLHVLIAAVERARSQVPLELHMFCPPNDNEEAEYWVPLQDRVRRLGGSIWREGGPLDGPALRRIHSTVDVLALPSVWPDFCPLVILEAQALGTPVVSSDFQSQREVFAQDQSGVWFVAPGDVDAWATCLISIWRAKLHGALRAPICCVPTIEEYAHRLVQTYHRARHPLRV
jgi:glycosyltransferase involved in cell wall biosynthesis